MSRTAKNRFTTLTVGLIVFAAGVLAAGVSATGAGAAETGTGAAKSSDFSDRRCLWSPFNQQEQGDFDGPWQCNESVGVLGNTMTLNGLPWRSKGVTVQAFVRPHDQATQTATPAIYQAQMVYGDDELSHIRDFGADTIRFQVSQPSLDPQSPLYDGQYAAHVIAGLKRARQKGFVVMIMMQDETISGSCAQQPMATAQTLRDWQMLEGIFGHDRGVLFELYNEPRLIASAQNWQLWKSGGTQNDVVCKTPDGNGGAAVGMQSMIDALRSMGSLNVFVLDGLMLQVPRIDDAPPGGTTPVPEAAATLQGMPPISDPLGRVVYAVHPYPHGFPADTNDWDIRFGNASAQIPVDADEWSAQGGAQLGLLDLRTYDVAVRFLNYLRVHPTMSLGAGAFDIPGFIVHSIGTFAPTDYDNYCPTASDVGTKDAGLLVRHLYRTQYRDTLTKADGVTPGAATATSPSCPHDPL